MSEELQSRLEQLNWLYDVPETLSIAHLTAEDKERVLDLIDFITTEYLRRMLALKYGRK